MWGNPKELSPIFVELSLDSAGVASARGIYRQTNSILFAVPDGTSASCADSDGDGTAGLTGFTIGFRDVRTGGSLVVTAALPGEIDEAGWHDVFLVSGTETLPARVYVSAGFLRWLN